MTYEELVKKMQTSFGKVKAEGIDHIAIEFDIRGEGEGALYLEIKDGKIDVQPYEYFDRDHLVVLDSEVFVALCEGKISLADVTGNEALAGIKAAKKAPAKKAPAKTAEKKPAAKKAAAPKAAEKKAPAKKPAAKKTAK